MAKNINQLALFTLTQPTLADGMKLGTKLAEDGQTVVSMSLSLDKRKSVAELLNLKGKGNADKLTTELLKLSDGLKEAALGEFVKMGTSQDWTGGRFAIRQSKSGKRTATMTLVSANREGRVITDEELAKALSRKSEDEQVAIMERAELMKAPAAPAIEA